MQEDRVGRPVLVQTVRGPLEGRLDVHPRTRTTDHLNMACPRFVTVTVDQPQRRWCFEPGTLSVGTDYVLFIMERKDTVPVTDRRIEAQRFNRVAVRIQLGDWQVHGFMHVPALSDPMARLVQNRQPYVPLTAVTLVGPDTELAASFLAINPRHIVAVQSIAVNEASAGSEMGAEAAMVTG